MEKMNIKELTKGEMNMINGGGILRKYGEIFGEKVGAILIGIGAAFIMKKIV